MDDFTLQDSDINVSCCSLSRISRTCLKRHHKLLKFFLVLTLSLSFLQTLLQFSLSIPSWPRWPSQIHSNLALTEFDLRLNCSPEDGSAPTDDWLLVNDEETCREYRAGFPTAQEPSLDERDFSLAFTFAVHKQSRMFARLLRAVYRPNNQYCIHIDEKSSAEFHEQVSNLTRCLDPIQTHVHVLPRNLSVDVSWGCYSNFACHFNCMQFLLGQPTPWKYLINASGQEFPLKTNREIVAILRKMNGKNVIEGKMENPSRNPPASLLPFKVTWVKGSVYIAATREFIQFASETREAKQILQALMKHNEKVCRNMDELFFSTLNYNRRLAAPGGCPLNASSSALMIPVFASWYGDECYSKKTVRGVCIFGQKDVPNLMQKAHLFANKFYEDFEPQALACLEKWLAHKVTRELQTGTVLLNKTILDSYPVILVPASPKF